MKKWLLFCLFFVLCERFCYFQTEGFALSKINAQETDKAPSQTLRFLGSGKQFYAFESEDGKTVVKFIKQSRRKPLPFLANLPLPTPFNHLRNSYLQKREKRLRELTNCCHIAFSELAEETGLLATHLNSEETPVTILIDKIGIARTVQLEKTQFIIQKKARLLEAPLTQDSIDSMIALISSLGKKGFVNLDPMIKRNFGLIDGKMALIDCGSLKKDQKLASYPDFQRAIFLQLIPLREHLKNKQPHDVPYFDHKMQKALEIS